MPRSGGKAVRRQVGAWLRSVNYMERLTRYLGVATLGSRWESPPQVLAAVPGRRALVLAPHMDDETVGCGGTIRKMATEGKEISVLFMTDGRQGDRDLLNMSEGDRSRRERALVMIRKSEAHRACEVLGITSLRFLDQEDAQLRSTEPVQQAVREVLASVKPDIVFTPFFVDQHPDHKMTAKILFDVLNTEKFSFTCLAYEVWTPLFPNVLVDISGTAEQKRQALHIYQSQLKDNDLVASVFGLNAYRYMAVGGTGLAEAFWMGSASEYCALYRRHVGPSVQHDDSAYS